MILHPRKGLTVTISALKWSQLNIQSVARARIKTTAMDILTRLRQSVRKFSRKDDLRLESFEILEQKRSPQSFRKYTD